MRGTGGGAFVYIEVRSISKVSNAMAPDDFETQNPAYPEQLFMLMRRLEIEMGVAYALDAPTNSVRWTLVWLWQRNSK